MNALQYKDLLINFTTEFAPIWNDKGTRSQQAVTFWRPSTSSDALSNFISLGDVAIGDYHNINHRKIVAVVSEADNVNGTALRTPDDFELVWRHSGKRVRAEVSIWRPIPPRGYVALGMVCGVGNEKPPRNTVRCVRADLVVGAHPDQPIWNDKGSGAHNDFSAWNISPPEAAPGETYLAAGTFVGATGYARPTQQTTTHALRLDLPLHTRHLPPLPPMLDPQQRALWDAAHAPHVCELPWFAVKDPELTPIEQLSNCPTYRLERNDQYILVSTGHNPSPISKTFNWTVYRGEVDNLSAGLRALTGIGWASGWSSGHPLKICARLDLDFTHTATSAKGWGQTSLFEVIAYVPANKSIGAYLIRSEYKLLRTDGSQLGATLKYANGENVHFSELLPPQPATPEQLPTAPDTAEATLEITPHDGIDDTFVS